MGSAQVTGSCSHTKKGKSGKAEFGLNFSQSISFLPSTPLQMRGHGERRVHNILAQHQRIGHNDYTTNRYILPVATENPTAGNLPSTGLTTTSGVTGMY